MKKLLALSGSVLLCASVSQAQVDSSGFELTPSFTETFAGGTTVGQWELDPDLTAAITGAGVIDAPSFITSTPAGLGAITTADPVGSSADGGVMQMGNDAADSGTHFGLNYVHCINSESAGTGTDFTTLVDYKIDASIWVLGTAEYTGSGDRWQVGPYFHSQGAASLFKGSIFYNVGSTGSGAGIEFRGLGDADAPLGTTNGTALTNGDWRLFRIIVSGDSVGIGYDANDNGVIDESDPEEFNGSLTRDAINDTAEGGFGLFTVGDVSRDVHPLFVDTVELYLPSGPSSAEEWALYDY